MISFMLWFKQGMTWIFDLVQECRVFGWRPNACMHGSVKSSRRSSTIH